MGGGSSTQAKPLRAATAIPPALAAALEEAGLNQYAAAMVAEGWDDVRHLSSLDDASLYDVAADVEMKRGHAARFVSHFGSGRAGGGGGGERGGLGASSRREGLDRSGGARQGSRSIRSYEAADLVAEPLDEESLSDMVILAVEGPVEVPRAADATAKAEKKERRGEASGTPAQSNGPPASAEEGGSSSKKAQRRTSVQPAGGGEGGQADGSPSAEGEEEGASPRVPGERAAKKKGKKKAEGELQADAGGEAEGEGEGGKATREKKSKKRAEDGGGGDTAEEGGPAGEEGEAKKKKKKDKNPTTPKTKGGGGGLKLSASVSKDPWVGVGANGEYDDVVIETQVGVDY